MGQNLKRNPLSQILGEASATSSDERGGLAGPRLDSLPFGRNVHIETDLIL